jgi:hypothetical protein
MSNKGVLSILIGLVILFGFILTCPNKEDHKQAIVGKVETVIKSDTVADDMNALKMIGGAVISKMIEVAADKMVTVDNYFIFSLGSVRYHGEKRLVSIGILHHVFCLFSEKDLNQIGSSDDAGILQNE